MIYWLAGEFGFQTIATVRRPEAVTEVESAGADFVVDTSTASLQEEVFRITGGRGVVHALDCIGGETLGQLIRCLGLNGRVVSYGTLGGEPVSLNPRDLMMPFASVQGFYLGNWFVRQKTLKILGTLSKVKSLIQAGVLSSTIRAEYRLDDYESALTDVQNGGVGKVLFRL